MNELAKADSGGIRQIEHRSFGAYRQRSGHTAGRDTPLDAFRVDPMKDLVSGIGGHGGAGSGSQFYGGRSIRRSSDVDRIEVFRALAQTAIEEFRDTAYVGSEFAFVDDFVPVEDSEERGLVTSMVIEMIRAEDDRVDAFMPDDLVGYEEPEGIQFVLLPGERASKANRMTLTPSNLATAIRDAPDGGLARTIRFLDASRKEVATATVLDCVSTDFELDGVQYVISDGDVYRVHKRFLDRVNADVAAIPSPTMSFPEYMSGPEPAWLGRATSDPATRFVRVDPRLIRIVGETSFEAADMIHDSGALIYVKRKGRSSSLSYAMVQARRGCQLLATVQEARDQLDAHVREADAGTALKRSVRERLASLGNSPSNIAVVLLILGRAPKTGISGLPLLAKLELSETSRLIPRLGYEFSLAFVGP